MTTVAKIQEFALPKQQHVKRIVYAGLCVLALSVSMYVYFVGKIVFDVVGRRTAEASILASQSNASELATNYFNAIKGLDVAQAQSMGLAVSNNTLYATRSLASTQSGTAVAMANE